MTNRIHTIHTINAGANLYSLASCFVNELQQVKPRRGDRVNHRSHVDGFLIGGVFYVAWRYGPRLWARLKGQRGGGGTVAGNPKSDSIWG